MTKKPENKQNNINSISDLSTGSNILVVADDITGAAEIAGVCLRYGLTVSLGINDIPDNKTDVQVIATDSRSLTEQEAFINHINLARLIHKQIPAPLLFKKCDSILRGHVLAELYALSEVCGKKTVILQPANPSLNRIIRNGIYFIESIEIHKTGFAYDPDFPTPTSSVKDILLSHFSKKSQNIIINTGNIEKIDSDGIFIPDCESENTLKKSADFIEPAFIISGSAAFFSAFLEKNGYAPQLMLENSSKTEEFLIISGSTHPESKKFREKLIKNGVRSVVLPDDLLSETTDIDKIAQQIIADYHLNKKLILSAGDQVIPDQAKLIKQRLSAVVKKVISQTEISQLFIEGGATTFDILQTTGLVSFQPLAELSPGVVKMQSTQKNNFFITIKPGSYKWPDIFVF
jgi:D-threonate/D-erythronate kinase